MNTPKAGSGEPDSTLSQDEAWVKQALQSHLDEKVDSLDFNVTSKLSAARHRAMAQDGSTSTGSTGIGTDTGRRWTLTPSMIGTTAVVALAFVLGLQMFNNEPVLPDANPNFNADVAPLQTSSGALMEDLQLLSASEDIEFFQSMELLEWLDQNAG